MSVQALYTAATGMNALQTKLDVISHNLANMETTAYKEARADFEDLFYRQVKLPGAEDSAGRLTPTGIAIGLGTRVSATQTDFSQGSFVETGQELDVAIEGKGFFQVQDPSNGNMIYTRAGTFSKNSEGQLVISSANVGRLLQPPITIPQDATEIVISSEGKVSVRQPSQTKLNQVGTIELVSFINQEGLLKLGEGLYSETDASAPPRNGTPGKDGLGTLCQGYLEASNVQPVTELINLITTQRAFELNSQAIQAGDELLQVVANLRRS